MSFSAANASWKRELTCEFDDDERGEKWVPRGLPKNIQRGGGPLECRFARYLALTGATVITRVVFPALAFRSYKNW